MPDKLPDGREVVKAKFSALETVALKPSVALSSGAQFMDLAGDSQPDLVTLDGPTTGLYEHDEAEGWEPFRPFMSRLNRDTRDPNLKFVDLDGDGHADALITEDDALVWHPSLAEAGFGPAHRLAQSRDEEKGPRLVFADRYNHARRTVLGSSSPKAQGRGDGETRATGCPMEAHQGFVAWQGERPRADGNGYPNICGGGALDRRDRGALA